MINKIILNIVIGAIVLIIISCLAFLSLDKMGKDILNFCCKEINSTFSKGYCIFSDGSKTDINYVNCSIKTALGFN